jgi:F-type H+/Na+-transporting ATPase subunit alpha
MNNLRPEEISKVLKLEIEGFRQNGAFSESGTVMSSGDGTASVYGLSSVMYSELVRFSSGAEGIAFSLLPDSVGCVILSGSVKEGDEASRTGSVISVPVGDALVGRIVDPLGNPADKGGPIASSSRRPIENEAPGVLDRAPVNSPVQTGIKAVDSMIPIGRGQRELIIGDRGTGKTALTIDTILNQKDSGIYCVYVAIGQKASTVAGIADVLKSKGAMSYTTIVFAGADDPPALQYIAPYAGCAIAEEHMYTGRNALIIYDDLSKHAVAYRQLSLLLRRPPGREAYPGDIFYLHSRLLERSARLSDKNGSGSLTALPIVETQAGDISSYIPTNIISITDGQIYLESDLFNSGIKPAINAGLSVSRVGGAAQVPGMKSVAANLRLDLAQYRELQAFSQFSSDIDKGTSQRLLRGEKLVEMLKQDQYEPMPVADQIVVIFAGTRGAFDGLTDEELPKFQKGLVSYVRNKYSSLAAELAAGNALEESRVKQLSIAVNAYKAMFGAKEN